MDWDTYKTRCDEPDMLSRWMLEHTAALLAEPLATRLLSFAEAPALAKPADHKGGRLTDMFALGLTAEESRQVLDAVRRAEAAGLDPTGRGLGGFEAAWSEYHEYVRNQTPNPEKRGNYGG